MAYRQPIYERLAGNDIRLTVLFGKSNISPEAKNTRAQYWRLSNLNLAFSLGSKGYSIPLYPQVFFHIVKGRPDVVLLEGETNVFNNMLAIPAARLVGAKIIWWGAGRRKGAKPNVLRRMMDPIINQMMRHCDACIAYSTLAHDYMTSVGVDPKIIHIAFNTVDTEKVKIKIEENKGQVPAIMEELGLQNSVVLIFVGVLERRKRVEDLLECFAILRREIQNLRLLIVGDGPHRSSLEQLARQFALEGVCFTGRKVDDLSVYLLASDVFVLPSEGGLGLVEAMAHGLPVVATSADGTELDLVRNGENGYIVPEGDIRAMADAIRKILNTSDRKEKFPRAAKIMVEGPFSATSFVDTIKETILEVMGKD